MVHVQSADGTIWIRDVARERLKIRDARPPGRN
jgi:hypothetical protein